MCVSLAPATFAGTTLYVGRKQHPALGPIEVLGYQNQAVNLARTPNAMILHVPATLSKENFLWPGEHDDVLQTMVRALTPAARAVGAAPAGAAPGGSVEVFDHDIYTMVLAQDPTQIPHALHKVPENKRPPLDAGLFQFYGQMFPYHSVVLCCFDNAEAHRAKPLLIWYPPPYQDWVVLPALDCHTGGVPDLAQEVRTDHWLVFGADDAPEGVGTPVTYREGMDPALRAFLPGRVFGAKYQRPAPNGDFALPVRNLRQADISALTRLQPTRQS